MRTLLLTLPLTLVLATGAQAQGYGYGPWPPRYHGPGLGTVGGAVAGGLVGRAIAGRHDNRLAILGGAALGAAVGSALAGSRPSWLGAGPDELAGISDRPRALAEVRARLDQHERHRLEHQRLQMAAAASLREVPDVVSAQRLLLALGYDPGPIDGIFGPRTRAGVVEFEAAQGLPRTGALTPSTVRRMKAALLGPT